MKTKIKNEARVMQTIDIPKEVKVSYSNNSFEITGPKGKLNKKIIHPKIFFEVKNNQILIFVKGKYTQREKKNLFTYKAHIKNFLRGVQQGHEYKLKVCSGHFPMAILVKNNIFEIKNLLGETIPRRMPLREGVNVKVDGNTIIVDGIDKDSVSQTAADIETLAKRPGFDKRVYMDGIWIIEKDGKPIK